VVLLTVARGLPTILVYAGFHTEIKERRIAS
jgi:hypothetical protein